MDCPDEADKIMSANEIQSLAGKYGAAGNAERENGSIIVSSIGGLKGSPVIGTLYFQGRRLQLVRNLAVEHGSKNVRANAIAPGWIKTYFAKALWDNQIFWNNPPRLLRSSVLACRMR